MPGFEQGDVVRIPFPYTDRNARQHRPALVISKGPLGSGDRLLWVAMITSAENRPWPDDVPLGETYAAAGLPAPSVIRPSKIATIDVEVAQRLGRINEAVLSRTMKTIRDRL